MQLPPPPTIRLYPLGTDPRLGCGYWLEIGSYGLLLDCGDPASLEDLPRVPDLVVCSHAHPDHLRGLPPLHRRYPTVPCYGTRLTYRLAAGLWDLEDPFPPLRCLPYDRASVVLPNLSLSFFRAGHLPGAAVTVVQYTGSDPMQTCIYTGDCSLASTRFSEGVDLVALRHWQPDVLLIEGTLGIADYPSRRQAEGRLIDRIAAGLGEGSVVIIPVPALGLGQELLFLLKTHQRFTHAGSECQIWLDPSLQQACELYEEFLSDFPQSVQNFARDQPLFVQSRVQPHVVPILGSDWAQAVQAPGIILCDAATDPAEWIPLWQALAAEPSRALVWIQLPEVQLKVGLEDWPESMQHRIRLETFHWHSHNDRANLVQIVHTLRPQHVVLVHGEPEDLSDLADLPELSNRYHLHYPTRGFWLDLPSSNLHDPAQTALPDIRYEGDVEAWLTTPNAIDATVRIRLPAELAQDPRWAALSDTGLVEARWQEGELIVRGLSARELLLPVEDSSDRVGLPRTDPGAEDPGWGVG